MFNISSQRKYCPLAILRLPIATVLGALLILSNGGCRKADAPPPALTLEELPPALEKAFAKPKAEATEPLNVLQAALKEKNFAKALEALHVVSALPGLTREQANVAAAGLVTVDSVLQEEQSKGNQAAAEALQTYRATK